MSKLYESSATEIIKKIKMRELRVVDVAQSFVDRINEVNPALNAVQQFQPERILCEAEDADFLIQNGNIHGKLRGLPVTIKDAFHVKGFTCSKGCPSLFKNPSDHDSTIVSRLKSEGAIIYGITNTPELLLAYETDNLIYGRTNNPYDLNRTPGGSSGGQAAIVSAGGTPVGIGNDAGGSLRQPAHYCGICSHKPTHGLIPNSGNIPLNGSGIAAQLISVGPMARYIEDLILLMDVISGSDEIDPHAGPIKYIKHQKVNLKSLRVAYFYDNPTGTMPTADTVRAVDTVVQLLKPQVECIEESYPAILDQVYRLHFETFMLGGDGSKSLLQQFEEWGQKKISPLMEEFLSLASKCEFSVVELRQRFVELEKFRYAMMEFMKNYDLIISPVTATPAHYHGETFKNIRDVGYLTAHNLTGWPATVLPCAYSKDGLPIGIQLVSKKWQDHICLEVALYLQKTLGVFAIPQIENRIYC